MEIDGLPLHPLVVHAVVIFVPLSAVGAIAISVSVWVRRRYGWLTSAFGLIAMVSTFVAQRAGQSLYESFPRPTEAMTAHSEIAVGLWPWVVLLFLGALSVTVLQHLIDRGRKGTGLRVASWVGMALAVISGIGASVQVFRAGHSGSTAVWG
ncbi:DUF2231 domain-containing protein [Microlunatus speluncae]|uniref:DUF2231 domain-containing protein n=1 Tax=Microlunatus speluncae TaxID=2594267 RepID=UPI0012662FA5|nr:DUF2231 domain-containing protein [Microlunatus speluncae]